MSAAAAESTPGPVSVPYYDDEDDMDSWSDKRMGLSGLSDYDRMIGQAERELGVKIGKPGRARTYKLVVYGLVRPLALFYGLWHPVRVEGLEHLPKRGAYVMLSNHQYLIDPFLVVSKYSKRPVHAVNKLQNFKKWYAFIIRAMGQIPFIRKGTTAQKDVAMNIAGQILQDGGIVALYPEGSRAPGIIAKWHAMVIFELRKRFPAVTVVSISMRYTKGFRGPTIIKIGQPVVHNNPATIQDAREITNFHRSQIVAMSPSLRDEPQFDTLKGHIQD